jgi:hypothetical protein
MKLCAAFILLVAVLPSAVTAASGQPNIIVILCDDVG